MFYIYWMQWSLLYFVQIKIMCSVQIYLFCTFFIHTYLFLNYYKTIALTTGQIIAKSSCSCSIKGTGQRWGGTGQRWGDQPASRGPASVEGTGQRQGDRPASRGLASIEGNGRHRRDRPASMGTSVLGPAPWGSSREHQQARTWEETTYYKFYQIYYITCC